MTSGSQGEQACAEAAGTATEATDHGSTPTTANLAARTARGAGWAVIGYGASQAIRLLSTIILTRLLAKDDFGRMAIVVTIIQGVGLLSDIGVGPFIIQNKEHSNARLLNTAWTMCALRGFLIWLASIALAWPLAAYYKDTGAPGPYDEMLLWMIPVAGFGACISGFESTKTTLLARDLVLGRLTLLEFGTQVITLIVAATWAVFHPSAWALLAGYVVAYVVRVLFSHVALPGERNRFAWDPVAARQIYRFGRWIFLSTLLTFLSAHADRLIFGKLVDMSELGLYSIAAAVAALPVLLLGQLSRKLLFPLFSRVHHGNFDLAQVSRNARVIVLAVTGWGVAGLLAGGPTAIRLMYPDQYDGAGWITQLLSAGVWLSAIGSINTATLLAKGRTHWDALGSGLKIAAMAAVIVPLHIRFGFVGAVAGYVGAEVAKYAVTVYATVREELPSWGQDLRLSVLVIASSFAGWVCAGAVERSGSNVWIEAITVFVVVSAFWVVPWWNVGRRLLRGDLEAVLFEGAGSSPAAEKTWESAPREANP